MTYTAEDMKAIAQMYSAETMKAVAHYSAEIIDAVFECEFLYKKNLPDGEYTDALDVVCERRNLPWQYVEDAWGLLNEAREGNFYYQYY